MAKKENTNKNVHEVSTKIEGEVWAKAVDKAFVEKHLQICPECNKKYIMLKELIYELRNAYQQLNYDVSAQDTKQQQFNIKEHENFQTNLSAYFDNELPLNESLSMKKYMIKYPKARKELEALYNLHSVIISSFNNTKRYLKQVSLYL